MLKHPPTQTQIFISCEEKPTLLLLAVSQVREHLVTNWFPFWLKNKSVRRGEAHTSAIVSLCKEQIRKAVKQQLFYILDFLIHPMGKSLFPERKMANAGISCDNSNRRDSCFLADSALQLQGEFKSYLQSQSNQWLPVVKNGKSTTRQISLDWYLCSWHRVLP